MSRERVLNRLAGAIRDTSHNVLREEVRHAERAVVRTVAPLRVELTNARLVLEDEDLIMSQEVRRYDYDFGIAVGDTVVLIPVTGEEWVIANVVSQQDVLASATQAELDAVAAASGAALGAHTSLTTTAHGGIVADSDTRLPTQGENDALVGTSGTPSSLNKYVTGADVRLPTTNENDALLGTSGAPSNTNRYVTDADSRLAVEARRVVGQAGQPAFESGWANFAVGSWQVASFWKDPFGIVHIEGLVTAGSIGATIFTLPVGYRPPFNVLFPAVEGTSGHGRLDVDSGGHVLPVNGNNSFFGLNVNFRVT